MLIIDLIFEMDRAETGVKADRIDFQKGEERCQSDRKSTRLNSSHSDRSRMPSSA